jgi:hypothetical protein
MTNLIFKLSVAAALATLAPALAKACEPEPPKAAVTFGVRARVPAVVFTDWNDHDRDDWRDRDRGWGRDEWRERHGQDVRRAQERAALRAEYARLTDARADFYAVPRDPWRVRRFEAWYAQERAALDARWARVG